MRMQNMSSWTCYFDPFSRHSYNPKRKFYIFWLGYIERFDIIIDIILIIILIDIDIDINSVDINTIGVNDVVNIIEDVVNIDIDKEVSFFTP